MIKNNKEFFKLIDDTILKLEQTNHQQDADRLKRALHISSLPGEIFGELMLALKAIIETQTNIDETIKSMLEEAYSCVKKTLK